MHASLQIISLTTGGGYVMTGEKGGNCPGEYIWGCPGLGGNVVL